MIWDFLSSHLSDLIFILSLIEPTSFTQKEKNSPNWNARNQLSMFQRPEAFDDWERLRKISVRFSRKSGSAPASTNIVEIFFFAVELTRSFPIHKSPTDLSFSAFWLGFCFHFYSFLSCNDSGENFPLSPAVYFSLVENCEWQKSREKFSPLRSKCR